jgi:hypothetical protein
LQEACGCVVALWPLQTCKGPRQQIVQQKRQLSDVHLMQDRTAKPVFLLPSQIICHFVPFNSCAAAVTPGHTPTRLRSVMGSRHFHTQKTQHACNRSNDESHAPNAPSQSCSWGRTSGWQTAPHHPQM